jgi:hypothetical protein
MTGTPLWLMPSPSLEITSSMGSGWSRSRKTGASVASTTFPTKRRTAALGSVMLPALTQGACLKMSCGRLGRIYPTISGVWQTLPQIVLLQVGS